MCLFQLVWIDTENIYVKDKLSKDILIDCICIVFMQSAIEHDKSTVKNGLCVIF